MEAEFLIENHDEQVKDEDDESDGNTSFLRAARDGNLQEVLEYLKGSTDINTSNPNGLNALHLASKEGHIDIVQELLKRGANVEAATKKGNTALHIASLAGHLNIVKLLVDNGAKYDVQAHVGFTPLYMAAQEGHADVVKYLLSSGANQSLSTKDGFTPLAVALQQGHERVVSVLLENDTKGKVKLPALHVTARKDDVKSAALLLQNEQNNVDGQTKTGGLVNDTTKSGFTPLHIAAHYGNTNVGSLLIQRGADVNFKAKNNITPLHVASRWGKPTMITLLLDNKGIADEKTRDGLTPLHCAARSGHENVVDLLIERGAPKSAKTKNGLTPLHMAAQGDHVDCARLLLYHRAPVDDVTVDYLTPLHVAAHCGNVKTAKLLLDRKCDPNSRALNGFTPLHIACKKNRIKVVELLLKYGATIEATTESGLTPLHVASFMGHMNIVIYLIQNNANPDFTTVRGETALHLAARANQTDIIRILLRNGATVDARAREQQTPLHIASRLGNVDNVTLLLQLGAAPDAVTKDLYTPLHIAAKEGHEEVASVLLEHGASHGLTTKKGFTPLHIAAKYGNIKVARLLLQKDANPDCQGKNGLTPLHVATHYNHVNVALLLLDNKASPHSTAKNGYTPLHIAAKKNQMDIATTLLEFGARPDAESKNGFTPLHLAAQEGHTDMVSLLLEHKADVNSKAQNGLTSLHLAAQEDKVNVAEVLVKYGTDIDPQTKAGYTPLHTACHFGQMNMVRFLLERDASVSATTKLGYTPLHQAAQQGHVQVINLLLKNKASPNAVTNNGQTALSIAQRLGYISVVDTLTPVTEVSETIPSTEDKIKLMSPEIMQENPISDSDDEGGTSSERLSWLAKLMTVGNQSWEDSISLGEKGGSISPLDTSYEKDVSLRTASTDDARRRITSEIGTAMRYPSYLERGPDYEAEMRYFSGDSLMSPRDYCEAQIMTSSYAAYTHAAPPESHLGPGISTADKPRVGSYSGSSFSASFDPDNVAIDQTPAYSGFLISFMVDARGGAMRGRRHSGIRIIIPPNRASMPTRVTCRLIKKDKLIHPIPLNEGEALAARIIEMGPVATKFLGRIVIEIPHFASLRGKEREIKILRSNNGEKWEEHSVVATDDAVQKALHESMEDLDYEDELAGKRVTRILTDDFPRYFALVTKVKEEKQWVDEKGLIISSTVVPQVQAVFPEGAVNKKIKVGLQAQPISPDIVSKLLGNRVAVSPIVTVEPRRRKFHKNIVLTIPVPKAAQKGMINQYGNEAPTLRVLYSISEGTESAVWDDLTDQTELKFTEDCVSFTTRVSGRFWLMDCQNVADACRFATELYKDAIVVPYMARFVVFAKRTGEEEGKLRMFCMTDDRIDKTLEKQEHFGEVARSRDVEVLEGRPQYVEMAGNLIPITKSGDQLYISFKAFRENRLPCLVKIRDRDQDPAARVAFMKEPKVVRGELPQTPICNLNIALPDMSTSSSMEMDPEAALELKKRSSLLREHGIVLEDTISNAKINLSDVADTLKGDWVILATQLDISGDEIHKINSDYRTVNDQALAMLSLWKEKKGDQATGNELERALRSIKREDVVQKCMYNVETIQDEVELAAAKVAMDQSGFDTFAEEIGVPQDSMKRNMSLDVQFDEKDIQKDSESAAESPASEGPAPQAYEEDMEESQTITEEELTSTKQDRPKSDEIIAKVEELGQQMAPVPAQEPTEDEEGTKTPPPSPVEGEFVSEEIKAQQAAVDELAARLSSAEDFAEHPGETETVREVVASQEVQTTESAARQTTVQVGESDVDTGFPFISDQKEPDMEKLVESLKTDLYEKERTEKSGNESDVSSSATSDTEGEFNIDPLPSTAPSSESNKPVVGRQISGERKRKRTDSLSSSSLSDVEDNVDGSMEEKEPVVHKSSLHDASGHEPKTSHVHFKEDLSSSSSSSSTEDETKQMPSIKTESESNNVQSPAPSTPKIDRMEEFQFIEKPTTELKGEKGAPQDDEDSSYVPVKVYKPVLTAQETIEEGLKMLPDVKDGGKEIQPMADSEVEEQIVQAPAPPKEQDSSSSSSSDEDDEKKRQESFREGSIERTERYEEVPPKEQTQIRPHAEGSKDDPQVQPHAEGSKDDPQVQPHAEGSKDDPQVQPHSEGSKDDPQVQPHAEGSKDDPQGELSASPEVTDSVDAVPFTKTVKRLQRMSSQQQQEVIESELLEEEESTTEQVLPDGSKVKRKRFKSGDSGKGENGEQECMELVEEEGPEKEDVKFEEDEEVLDDGTVHRISRTRRQSIKHLKRTLISESGEEENIFEGEIAVPGKAKEDVIEVFEEPAKPVTQVEEIEVKRDDGVVVKRRMVMSRMVSNVKTFHQSFDDSGNLQEDEYAIEAIIPGTESAFVEGDSSSSSSESSEDDDDENDEEINVDDLDRVEEDCQSGTTVTTRQVIKQTFTSGSYTTDGEPRELEDTGLVKRVVKKVTYDPGQPDVISDSTEYDDEVGLEVNTPVITITEDNSKPASEGDDHLAYFGYKSSPDDTELWIDENDFEESENFVEVEQENKKSVAEIVNMFEKDSQIQSSHSDVVDKSSASVSTDTEKCISTASTDEQSAAYFAEKEVIIVEKIDSEDSKQEKNVDELVHDDAKPVRVHRMVEIFEKINSQSSVDEPATERKVHHADSVEKSVIETTKDHDIDQNQVQGAQLTRDSTEQAYDNVTDQEETIYSKDEKFPPDISSSVDSTKEIEKPDELNYKELSKEYEIIEDTTSPLVIETVSPVARIVEDIESNVSQLQNATLMEQVVLTEKVSEFVVNELEPQFSTTTDDIDDENVLRVSQESQYVDEIQPPHEDVLTVGMHPEVSSERADETEPTDFQIKSVERVENFISEKDITPICEQSNFLQGTDSQESVLQAEETTEPNYLESSSLQFVEQYADEQYIDDKENELKLLNTDKQETVSDISLEQPTLLDEKQLDTKVVEPSASDEEQTPFTDQEFSTNEVKEENEEADPLTISKEMDETLLASPIQSNQSVEVNIADEYQVIDSQEELSKEMREEDEPNATSIEISTKTLVESQDEYELVASTQETAEKCVIEKSPSEDEDEDWELLDKDEIEDTIDIPDNAYEYSGAKPVQHGFGSEEQKVLPCVPIFDGEPESDEDVSDDTTEIADRSETCDIESPIEFKQPPEKLEESNETKTVQFDNKVLEVKSTSTGIESSVETRDIVKESIASLEEEDIESISSTEEYKIRKYEYDQEIKEKDTISKQFLDYSTEQNKTSLPMDSDLVRSLDTIDTDTEEELKTSVHEKHEYEQLSSQKLSDERPYESDEARTEYQFYKTEIIEQEQELTTPTQEFVVDYDVSTNECNKVELQKTEEDDQDLVEISKKITQESMPSDREDENLQRKEEIVKEKDFTFIDETLSKPHDEECEMMNEQDAEFPSKYVQSHPAEQIQKESMQVVEDEQETGKTNLPTEDTSTQDLEKDIHEAQMQVSKEYYTETSTLPETDQESHKDISESELEKSDSIEEEELVTPVKVERSLECNKIFGDTLIEKEQVIQVDAEIEESDLPSQTQYIYPVIQDEQMKEEIIEDNIKAETITKTNFEIHEVDGKIHFKKEGSAKDSAVEGDTASEQRKSLFVAEKELSVTSLSDEELVERPKRISISQDIRSEEVCTEKITDDNVDSNVFYQTDDQNKEPDETEIFQGHVYLAKDSTDYRQVSTETVEDEDEEVSVREEPTVTFKGRIEHDIISTADAEMEGRPVDFIAHSASDDFTEELQYNENDFLDSTLVKDQGLDESDFAAEQQLEDLKTEFSDETDNVSDRNDAGEIKEKLHSDDCLERSHLAGTPAELQELQLQRFEQDELEAPDDDKDAKSTETDILGVDNEKSLDPACVMDDAYMEATNIVGRNDKIEGEFLESCKEETEEKNTESINAVQEGDFTTEICDEGDDVDMAVSKSYTISEEAVELAEHLVDKDTVETIAIDGVENLGFEDYPDEEEHLPYQTAETRHFEIQEDKTEPSLSISQDTSDHKTESALSISQDISDHKTESALSISQDISDHKTESALSISQDISDHTSAMMADSEEYSDQIDSSEQTQSVTTSLDKSADLLEFEQIERTIGKLETVYDTFSESQILDQLEKEIDRTEYKLEVVDINRSTETLKSETQFTADENKETEMKESGFEDDAVIGELDETYIDRTERFITVIDESKEIKVQQDDRYGLLPRESSFQDSPSNFQQDNGSSRKYKESSDQPDSQNEQNMQSDQLQLDEVTEYTAIHTKDTTQEETVPFVLNDVQDLKQNKVDAGTPSGTDERPLSPSSYTLETDTDMEGSRTFEFEELEDAVSDIQRDNEQTEKFDDASNVKVKDDLSEKISGVHSLSTSPKDAQCPPSPSEFTLVMSHDQDMLSKALGLQEDLVETTQDMSEDQLPSHTSLTNTKDTELQSTFHKSISLDDTESLEENSQETVISQKDSMHLDDIFSKTTNLDRLEECIDDELTNEEALDEKSMETSQEFIMSHDPESLSKLLGIENTAKLSSENESEGEAQDDTDAKETCLHEKSQVTHDSDESSYIPEEDNTIAENEKLPDSLPPREANVMGGENIPTVTPGLQLQIDKLSSESRNVFSSYENVYEGVPLDPKINRLSLDASEMEIGDRFDTKQMDVHLQSDNRASSYEQVYAEEPRDQSLHLDLAAIEEDKNDDKISTSSSEVAQHDDDASDEDAEACEATENNMNETDVEEQFSPVVAKPFPKPVVDLHFETENPILSVTDSPTEAHSPCYSIESPDLQDKSTLSKPESFTVGTSPSEYHEHSIPPKEYEQELLKDSTDSKSTEEIDEQCLMCSYEVSNIEEEVVLDQSSEIHSETPANLQNEYPDFKSDSENFVIDTSKMKLMETRNCIQSVDEISPEDLEEKDFQFELPEKNRGSEDEEGDSERSSETSELTVFDENSGTYIRIPWESAYQFRRQFSETYEQNETEKKFVRTMKSIDLGSFYRRDKMEDEEVVVRKSSLCSTKHSAFGKEYKKEVRFAEQIVDITENVDLDSSQSDESEEQDERLPHEPHEQIDKIHEMTVIASIMEKRQYYEEEWSDEVQYQDSCTSTRDDQIEATGGASDEGGQQDLPGLTGDELFARDDVSTETTVTPTVETTSFAGIIVTEAEPVEEKEVNEISSISKEISLTSVGKFPMALPMIGKSIADNEIYESSETGGDTTEEKLSPIDETPQDDFLDEEQEVLKPAVVEKHVKFQTDIGHLRSGSSEDLVKTSTSSSEMEPTILAASYDLDSGRVSKVVATYDVSPDTVEKQFVAPPSAKAILSSPEDDVFEIENKRIFESSRSRSESEESTPSIKDKSVTVIEKSDIQELNEKELEVGSKSEGACGGRDSATSSPFEIMSPSELDGYDQYMERFDETKDRTESYEEEENKEGKMFPLSTENRESMTLQIIPKSDSSFDHSSLLSSETSEKDDSPFDMLSFSAQQDFEPLPDLVENTVESNKQIPSTLETRLPNGPTEVEFDPEIDVNCEQTCSLTISQPDLVQSLSHDKDLTLENSEVMMDKAENVTDGPAENVMIESQTVQTLSLMEELNITSQEHFISSDQTLYGLEMPSEENTVLTSLTQTQRHEVDTESDSVNVTEALVSQMEEDSSDQSISKEIDHCVELSTEKIQMEEQGSESGKQESIEKSQSKENAEIYHGKRALDIDDSAELDVRMESGCAGVIDETFEDEFDNVEEESFDTNLNEECDERGILFQNEQTEPFELDVDPYDLERPSTPTPVDINQHFFDDEAEAIVKNEEIEVQASEFVETVLTEAYARINQDTTCERNYESRAADSEDKQENLPSPVDVDVERNIFLDEENESTETKMDNDEEVAQDKFLERQVEKTSQQKHSIIMKQISEDIPGITLTTHYHDDGGESMQNSQATETEKILQSGEVNLNDTDEPIEAEVQQTFVFSSECIPEEPEDTVDGNISNASVHSYQAYHDSFEKSCIPEENDSEEEKEEVHITSSTRPLTVVFPQDKVDHGEIHFISKTDPVTDSEAIVDLQSTTNEYLKFEADVAETGYVGKYDSDDSLEENYNEEAQLSGNTCERTKLRQDSENLEISQCTLKEDTRQTDIKLDEKKCTKDILQEPFEHELSQDDIGDTSSVESFTTVVPVDQEDDDDGNYNRLDDFASMSSSYHSDVLGLDEDDKIEDFPIIDWTQKDVIEFEEINRKQSEEEEKRRELKRNQEEELLQRFEELKALRDEKDRPLIDWEEGSESSVDSDRYEYMDKTALSVITENSDEDKFEFLDNEDVKSEKSDRIFGSPEDFPPPSPGVNKFFNKSSDRDDISITSSLLEFERLEHEILASGSRGSIENEKDNISVTSSLAEFERFERELGQSSSTSSVEKMTSDSNSKESDKEGSRTSLNDVDKLDKDMERKDSVDSITRRSETSSLASLNEFERLEQEMALADELEAEAQKIVSILESGTLISEDIRSEKSSSLMTYSAKSAKKRSEFQAEDNEDLEDSLSEEKTSKKEVDQAEVDSLDGDVSELTSLTSSVILNQKAIKECDEDSLRDDEESMKISSDSLGEQLGLKSSSDKDKFDSDSLAGQEGIMEKSTDSLEADKKYSTIDRVETDSLCDEDDRQKPADVMQTSVDSLESSKSRSRENLMESSMYSVDSSIFSRSSVETMKSAGSQRSDSSTEIMQVSAESYEERKRREKKWLIDNYHSYRESGHGVEPLIDQEGNVLKSFRIDDNYEYGWDESDEDDDNKSTQIKPFSWGPYEEKKKIYTMAEWEAMKEEKRRASLVTEKSVTHSEQMETATSTVESQISTLVKNTTITTKSISSSETQVYSSSEKIRSSTSVKATPKFGSHLSDTAPQRIASIDDDDFVEYDVTEHSALMHGIPEHLAQKSGPIYIDPETIDSEEDEIIDYPVKKEESTDGAEGEETETHRLTMKKEIHSRTILKDGKEQTFVHEEAQIEQEEDPPEELKESMQQIIDQFMESPAQPDQYKALEHDV
ncbi:uncharacterized protein LOC125671322 isoform X7 [Ostrea edulis]|uniref:uncharacterized protein LOC125671322 isoform X7 n=1 Tax=Ostrea edulis TaxID=37623 RepID=UPI0024AF236B|nr:uncharacterized protein LOC125671322 isoform X7 [Ostrea edulis]